MLDHNPQITKREVTVCGMIKSVICCRQVKQSQGGEFTLSQGQVKLIFNGQSCGLGGVSLFIGKVMRIIKAVEVCVE